MTLCCLKEICLTVGTCRVKCTGLSARLIVRDYFGLTCRVVWIDENSSLWNESHAQLILQIQSNNLKQQLLSILSFHILLLFTPFSYGHGLPFSPSCSVSSFLLQTFSSFTMSITVSLIFHPYTLLSHLHLMSLFRFFLVCANFAGSRLMQALTYFVDLIRAIQAANGALQRCTSHPLNAEDVGDGLHCYIVVGRTDTSGGKHEIALLRKPLRLCSDLLGIVTDDRDAGHGDARRSAGDISKTN